jgi:hypothetical protein
MRSWTAQLTVLVSIAVNTPHFSWHTKSKLNRRVTVNEIAAHLDMSRGSAHHIIYDLSAVILIFNTVEPRFTNLIRFWGPFVNRSVRKPKLFFP